MKKFTIIFMFTFLLLALTGCKQEKANPSTVNQEEKDTIRIAALKGPTAMGMAYVMDKNSKDEAANNYEFTIAGAADEISTGLTKGDFDMAAIPCNLASVLYNKTEGKIKIAGINTLSVLYIVETGDTIHTMEDLKGKTIYSTGMGTTPQYTLNYLLNSYGIDPEKDVTIEYKTEATEVAALLSQAKDAIAMLPQPFVTTVMMNNSNVRIALDVAKEWDAINKDSSIVTGVIVARSDFLEANKEVVDTFMEEYLASTTLVNRNIDEAANLIEQFDIFKAAVAKKAIPLCNITLIQGEDMKNMVGGYLTTLFEQNPNSVGGALPADDFYYIP
ncbi:MAG: ABC transporter substrate-binding protein [Clostridiales bacterium]|jgi:NitT/TauT family transport system substrate-binding protein|nr:ABC transporter substrate-binding protein [Clostridiales bacterium]